MRHLAACMQYLFQENAFHSVWFLSNLRKSLPHQAPHRAACYIHISVVQGGRVRPTYLLTPMLSAGRGNTSALTRCDGTQCCVWTENGLWPAPVAEECVHFLLRHCWVQRHDSAAARPCARRLGGANAGELALPRERACGGRTPPLRRASAGARLLTYPPSLARWLCDGLTYLPPLFGAALT